MPYLTVARAVALGDLDHALTEHEVILEYLPKIDIRTAVPRMQGVEALVRWQHPRRGLLYPGHFLGSIEDHNLMARLTDFVMTEAVRQASQWRGQGPALENGGNPGPQPRPCRRFPG